MVLSMMSFQKNLPKVFYCINTKPQKCYLKKLPLYFIYKKIITTGGIYLLSFFPIEYNRATGERQDAQKIWTLVVFLEKERHGQQPGRCSGTHHSRYLLGFDSVPRRKHTGPAEIKHNIL